MNSTGACAVCITRSAAAITSLPMPSPGTTAIFFAIRQLNVADQRRDALSSRSAPFPVQPHKSCQALNSVEIFASASFDSEYRFRHHETFPFPICHTENRGQIHCPPEWKPALRLETSGHPEPGDRSLRRQLRLLHSPDLKDS